MLLALISAVATAVLPIPIIPLVSNHLEFLPNLYLLAALPAAAGTALLILGDRPRRKQRSVGRLFERRLAEKPLSGRA
jgi:hypothetical protein